MTVVEDYFEALGRRDAEAMAALWAPDGEEHIAGQVDARGPDGVRTYFTEFFAAFPDFALTVRSTAGNGDRTAVHWTATGTHLGGLSGLAPTGARVDFEGIDMLQVRDGLIVRNDAVADSMSVARQLGMLPRAGSPAEQRLFGAFNAKTKAALRAAGSCSATPTPTTAAPRPACVCRSTAIRRRWTRRAATSRCGRICGSTSSGSRRGTSTATC